MRLFFIVVHIIYKGMQTVMGMQLFENLKMVLKQHLHHHAKAIYI